MTHRNHNQDIDRDVIMINKLEHASIIPDESQDVKTIDTDSAVNYEPVIKVANQYKNDDKEDNEPKVKLSLTNLNVIATWKYNLENHDCKLCYKDLMLPVQEPGTNKINGDVTVGICNHAFHTVCINSWLIKKNISCPHCSISWKTASNVGSSVYMYKSTV